jgi:prepilin-type N-terminal cleavage/methylation domain-containing protein
MLRARVPGSPAPRHGFSLVELLVVIAIISTLVGLLLPAVQAARESGRRTSCANNVRQLANACQQHLEAQGHFPTGGWGQQWGGDADAGFGSKQPGGWHYSLLTYIEQAALRNDGQGQDAAGKRAAAKRVYETHVGSFVCPTRGVSAPVAAGSFSYLNIDAPAVAGRSDYAANGGDVVSAAIVDHAASASTTEQDILTMPGSAAGSVAGGDRATGVVFRGSVMRAAHLRDGLSNVYLLGERFIPRNQAFTSSATGNRHGWAVGFDDDSIRFTAAVPSGDSDDAAAGFEGRFGGSHAGVFPMAMADGSVHMIPFDIDPTTHRRLGHRKDGEVAMLP